MKKFYFFVVATQRFRKTYNNSKYDYDPNDHKEFEQKKVYGIEQLESQSDDEFFTNLTLYVDIEVRADAELWVKTCNKDMEPGAKWEIDHINVKNISKVS
jgi:hypothetical protein